MTTNNLLAGPVHTPARTTWQSVVISGVLSVIVGIVVLVRPEPTLQEVDLLIGAYIVGSSVLQLAAAFGTPPDVGPRVLAVISGLVTLMIGVFSIRDGTSSVLLLSIWIGICWLFRGVALILASAVEPTQPGSGRNLFLGALTMISGMALICWSPSSLGSLHSAVGVSVVVLGVVEIRRAIGIRNHVESQNTGIQLGHRSTPKSETN